MPKRWAALPDRDAGGTGGKLPNFQAEPGSAILASARMRAPGSGTVLERPSSQQLAGT
jgi:hypothetical protein